MYLKLEMVEHVERSNVCFSYDIFEIFRVLPGDFLVVGIQCGVVHIKDAAMLEIRIVMSTHS